MLFSPISGRHHIQNFHKIDVTGSDAVKNAGHCDLTDKDISVYSNFWQAFLRQTEFRYTLKEIPESF